MVSITLEICLKILFIIKNYKAEVHRLEKVGPADLQELKFFGVCIPGVSVSCARILSV